MNIDPKDIDLIERYLDDNLDIGERYFFEKRMKEDPEFERLVKTCQALPGILESAADYERTRKLVSYEIAESKQRLLHFIKPSYLAWAAVAVILIGTAIGYLVLKHQGKEQVLSGSGIKQKIDMITIAPGYKQPSKATRETIILKSGSIVSLKEPKDEIFFKGTAIITFHWEYKADSITHLYVASAGTDKIEIKTEIKPGTEFYTLNDNKLKSGRYYWFIGNKEVKRFFTIEK